MKFKSIDVVKLFFNFIKPSSAYDVVMRNSIYSILTMIFIVLILPHFEISGITGEGKIIKMSTPPEKTYIFYESILKDLFFWLLGSYSFKKVGFLMTVAFIAFSVYRTGGNVQQALANILPMLENEKNKKEEEVSKDESISN